jgi:hypothetical protein
MNSQLIGKLRGGYWMPDDHMLVSVVDEAHALINPEHSDARGQSGWPVNLGPQAYHIMRGSAVSIFLLDGEQSFRERESTTTQDIIHWAKELGAEVAPIISLAGNQFRCAGSKEYVDWVESVFAGMEANECATAANSWSELGMWRGESNLALAAEEPPAYGSSDPLPLHRTRLEFRVFDSPFDLENALRQKIKAGFTARLVAPFARKWITKGISEPHDLPPDMLDFHIKVNRGGRVWIWSRPWNVVPRGTDYTHFIQGPVGSRIHDDPLAEVGCPYAVRGFDFDYIGLLWLSDLRWRHDHWQVVPQNVHETGLMRTLSRARRENDPSGPHHQALLKKVLQAYRILLTRALKGVYIWFEDDLTREHIRAALGFAKR